MNKKFGILNEQKTYTAFREYQKSNPFFNNKFSVSLFTDFSIIVRG